MSMRGAGQLGRVILAGTLVLGCTPHQDATVVHVSDPPPAPAGSSEPLPEPELEPIPEPRLPLPWQLAPKVDAPRDPVDAARARARELFQEGAEAYAQGDFPKARDAFQAAYDLAPERALLFNIASAELRMRDMVSACAHFRQYVAEGDPSDPRVQQVQAQVASRCGGVP
jgi:hypothetical protein